MTELFVRVRSELRSFNVRSLFSTFTSRGWLLSLASTISLVSFSRRGWLQSCSERFKKDFQAPLFQSFYLLAFSLSLSLSFVLLSQRVAVFGEMMKKIVFSSSWFVQESTALVWFWRLMNRSEPNFLSQNQR